MGNIRMVHHDDGKCKWESHEVYLQDADNFYNDIGVWSHNIFEARGCGETQEEALNDLKKKLEYLFDELRAIEKMIFETNVLSDNIIEVDCLGKEIVKRG